MFAWPIASYVSVPVHQSQSLAQNLNLNLYVIKDLSQKDSSIKICLNLKISRISLDSSEVPDVSSDVPDYLRKFRTPCGSSGPPAEVPNIGSLKSLKPAIPLRSLPAPPSPPPVPPLSKSLAEVPEVPKVWISRSGRLESPAFHPLGFSLKSQRYSLTFALKEVFARSLSIVRSSQIPLVGWFIR